jgi:hypothetical protein
MMIHICKFKFGWISTFHRGYLFSQVDMLLILEPYNKLVEPICLLGTPFVALLSTLPSVNIYAHIQTFSLPEKNVYNFIYLFVNNVITESNHLHLAKSNILPCLLKQYKANNISCQERRVLLRTQNQGAPDASAAAKKN